MAAAIRRDGRAVVRWEAGELMPSPEQEKVLFELARCSRARFAEHVCKKLTRYIKMRVVILPEDAVRHDPATPVARAEHRKLLKALRRHRSKADAARALGGELGELELRICDALQVFARADWQEGIRGCAAVLEAILGAGERETGR